jgi:RecB family endonuclease NucS
MWWLLVALAALAVAGALFVVRQKRAQRRPDGMKSFRRHMDALSSDARQNVIGRVKDADAKNKGGRRGA